MSNIIAPSKYLQRKFDRVFTEGCPFWTGENVMLVSLVIIRRDDWAEVLRNNYSHYLRETIDPRRAKNRFVDFIRKEPEEDWSGVRKLWRLSETETPFPVIEYELKVPF